MSGNGADPDQTSRCAASDLGLHCLPMTAFFPNTQSKNGSLIKSNLLSNHPGSVTVSLKYKLIYFITRLFA